MNIIFTILGSSLVTTLIFWLTPILKNIVNKKIDNSFDKKLEYHKHELGLITENLKFDIQRKAFDFNLYTTKRHEIYKELYRKVLIAQGKVINLMSKQEFDYSGMNVDEIIVYLKDLKFKEPTLIEVKEKLLNDKTDRIKYLKVLLKDFEFY